MAKHHYVQIEKLKKQNESMAEALKFYADEAKWVQPNPEITTDCGKLAKETLQCLNFSESYSQ